MFTVYRKELRSMFTTMYGYAVAAGYLLFSDLFMCVINLFGAVSSPEMSYSYTSFVVLMLAPVLAARGMCEERHAKTDVLLLSLPLRASDIVLGKYFALITLTTALQTAGILPAFVLGLYGRVNALTALVGTFALILFTWALVAVGLFVSTLTDSVPVAVLVTLGAVLILYYLPDLVLLMPTSAFGSFAVFTLLTAAVSAAAGAATGSRYVPLIVFFALELVSTAVVLFSPSVMEGAAGKVFRAVSLTDHLTDIVTYGLLDLQGLWLFAGTAVLFCAMSVLSVENRRFA